MNDQSPRARHKRRAPRVVPMPTRIVRPAPNSAAMARAARQRRRRVAFLFPLALMGLDGALAGVAFWLAFQLRLLTDYTRIPPFESYLGMMAIHMVAMVTTYFFYKLYQRRRMMSMVDELARVLAGTSVGTVVTLASTSFLFKNIAEFDYPRLMVVYGWGLTIFFVALGRLLHSWLQRRLHSWGVATQHVLLVGSGDTAELILNAIARTPGSGYRVVGLVPVGNGRFPPRSAVPVLGGTEALPELVERHGIDEVIIGLPEANHDEIVRLVSMVQREKVSIKVFPDLFQFMAGEMSMGDLGGLPLVTVRDIALRGWKLGVKRALDVLIGTLLLMLFSPAMLMIAILIKLESSGPVFFSQVRMGLDSKPFRCLKFRSMRQDAERHATWTTENDPRVTRIGRFIRRTSLDEVPQFINVLLGEMSIVGPRPEQPYYVEQFRSKIPRYMDRHQEKAGITGWAQIHGLRGDTSVEERTKYDLWYIENWSLMLDFKIMVRTAFKMLFDRSAY